jgi:LysM repeat protein
LAFAFLAMLPLSGAFASSSVADNAPPPKPEVIGPNLLTNPGMEGHYVKQCSQRNGPHWVQVPCPADYDSATSSVKQWETAQVPVGWSAWWRLPNNNFDDPNYFNTFPAYCPADQRRTPADCKAWHNPEYRDTMGGPQETGPERRVAGENSQKYFTFYSVHEAGMYQVISGVRPGERLRFSVFMEGWSNAANNPFKSDLGQRMNLQVGIDPTGGNDPWSPNIIWTSPAESFDQFTQFVVEAVAKNNIVSVWTKSRPDMPLQHNDVYVDEASLNVVQPARAAIAPVRLTRIVTSTKIVTSTRFFAGANGVLTSTLVTRSVIVSQTVPVVATTTKPVTTTNRITAATALTSTKPATSTAPTGPVSGTLPIPASGTYTVVRGDTLIAIARRFGITPWWRLAELNDLQEPYMVDVGQVLKLR